MNPLQHMRVAKDRTIRIPKLNFVGDSVVFLERFAKITNYELLRPTHECFCNLDPDIENGFDVVWDNSVPVSVDEFKYHVRLTHIYSFSNSSFIIFF